MIELLQRKVLFVLLFNLDEIFDIVNQMQKLLIIFVIVERYDWDAVLQLVEIGIGCVVYKQHVL